MHHLSSKLKLILQIFNIAITQSLICAIISSENFFLFLFAFFLSVPAQAGFEHQSIGSQVDGSTKEPLLKGEESVQLTSLLYQLHFILKILFTFCYKPSYLNEEFNCTAEPSPSVRVPWFSPMRLCHPPDGSTSPKYNLLSFKPP